MFNMLFCLVLLDVLFIFMASAHLDKGVESISEFGIPTVQILPAPVAVWSKA